MAVADPFLDLSIPTLSDHNMMQGRCDTFVTRSVGHPPRVDLMVAPARRSSGRRRSDARLQPEEAPKRRCHASAVLVMGAAMRVLYRSE
jgi:hypothetical protein